MDKKIIQEVTDHIDYYIKVNKCPVRFNYKTLQDIMTSPRRKFTERLRLKLTAMEMFAHEHYNEKSFEAIQTVFIELRRWLDENEEN